MAFGSLAMLCLVFAGALTLKNFGLSVEDQLIAQRIIMPLLFVALGALAVSCEYFRRVRLQAGTKTGILLRILRLVAVVVLPAVIVIFTLKTPFWSFKSPSCWNRPQFFYGWFLPCKVERTPLGFWLLFLHLFLWTLYLMVLMGYRRIKHYFVLLWVMLGLLVPYSMFVGIKPVYRGYKPPSKSQPHTATMSHLSRRTQQVPGRMPAAAERGTTSGRQSIQDSRADVMHTYPQASLRQRRGVGQEGLVIGFNATSERNRT